MIGFIIGLFIGTCAGLLICALSIAGRNNDE